MMTIANGKTKLTFKEIVAGEHGNSDAIPNGLYLGSPVAERIECVDGESLSVQADCNKYCTPRSNEGPYTHLEVGYPSVKPPGSMMEYCEDPSKPTDTVYGYVPVAVIQEFIDAHGDEKISG